MRLPLTELISLTYIVFYSSFLIILSLIVLTNYNLPPLTTPAHHFYSAGYDGLPVEEMQGMGINSHPGSTYGPIQDMDMGQQHFEDMPPAPPQDNNQVRYHIAVLEPCPCNTFIVFQVAAWYDTDL